MIRILAAPPFATIQDLGREGYRHQGVPPSGAMDPEALALGNLLVGNPAGAAGLEWALGPGRIAVLRECRIAVTGADVEARAGSGPIPPWTSCPVASGTEIELGVPRSGRFCYLLVTGGVAVPTVLRSRSTYLRGRFGGYEGRLLRAGDVVPLGDPYEVSLPPAASRLPDHARSPGTEAIRVIEGPQRGLFTETAWNALEEGAFTVSRASDRMGYRLEGPALHHPGDPAMPSEPACPGAIQVPADSAPIVLMPDGPTVGGYPKLAAVVSVDLGRMAQLMPGARVRFRRVSRADARVLYRESLARLDRVRRLLNPAAR